MAETDRASAPLLTRRIVRVCAAVAPCVKLKETAPPSMLSPPVGIPRTTIVGVKRNRIANSVPPSLTEKRIAIWKTYVPGRVGMPLTRLPPETVNPGGTSPLTEVEIVTPSAPANASSKPGSKV